MKIIVIGSTGILGKAITQRINEQGNEVIEASRKGKHVINIEEKDSIERFYQGLDPVDAIICAAGNASFGALYELTDDQIQLGLNSKLLGQVNVCRMGLEHLKPNGVIILTGGMLAYSPWPATSNVAMVNAGIEGFVRAAALECKDNKRITIVHPPLIKETAVAMGMESGNWPPAYDVAQTYLDALNGDVNGAPLFVRGYEA